MMISRLATKFGLPMPLGPPMHEPERAILIQLAVLIFIALIFHFTIASSIVAGVSVLLFGYKVALLATGKKAPWRTLMVFFTIFAFAVVIFAYQGWSGRTAGVSFLSILLALKFLESRTLRDYYVVCLVLYFLAASSFLFESSPLAIIFILGYTLAITAIMMKLSSPSPLKWTTSLSSAARVLGLALPIAAVLFFLFPRIQGNFGFIPTNEDEFSDSRLSDQLDLGEFANTAYNTSVAFRVEFETAAPRRANLYWRSKVMAVENRYIWRVTPPSNMALKQSRASQSRRSFAEDATVYTVYHEASGDKSLPYLEKLSGFTEGRALSDYTVWWQRSAQAMFSYQGAATFAPQALIATDSSANTLQRNLQVSHQPSARTVELLQQWQANSGTPQMLVDKVLSHFYTEEFRYSLREGPKSNQNPIDDFLFESRIGYCEHYASTFTTLMRWMGVPARVVVGFQGGEYNPTGEFYEIRYADAHAWSEVFIDDRWQRVDPTAAIRPDRIEFGMQALMSLWDGNRFLSLAPGQSLANYIDPNRMGRLFNSLKDEWDNLGHQWNRWIINYDSDKQRQLLKALGIDTGGKTGLIVALLFVLIGFIVLFYFWKLLPKYAKEDPLIVRYREFVRRFEHLKFFKQAGETPNEFANRLAIEFPDQAEDIRNVTRYYVALRFAQQPPEESEFHRLVKEFSLPRKMAQ